MRPLDDPLATELLVRGQFFQSLKRSYIRWHTNLSAELDVSLAMRESSEVDPSLQPKVDDLVALRDVVNRMVVDTTEVFLSRFPPSSVGVRFRPNAVWTFQACVDYLHPFVGAAIVVRGCRRMGFRGAAIVEEHLQREGYTVRWIAHSTLMEKGLLASDRRGILRLSEAVFVVLGSAQEVDVLFRFLEPSGGSLTMTDRSDEAVYQVSMRPFLSGAEDRRGILAQV